ncbi:MAG TPA: macro domain-containing protein [Rhizomicrobium sp.]|nr:macro domain-containing protein [Rhizomicrobium sp.]
MIRFTEGNLLEANAEAFVNTVNTVGVMGKGIALMFKEKFPENYREYERACKSRLVRTGHMFVTERHSLVGPKWIINFPTKQHWRQPSRLEWIEDGLKDLRHVLAARNIRSVAVPPLGSGNGGLNWPQVRSLIVAELGTLKNVDVVVFEPTREYQNVAKREGAEKLTPARALIAELVRRYSVLGIECTLLEIHKLVYFLERFIRMFGAEPLGFEFEANRYGPYSDKLRHMLNSLDGSYLHCEKRLSDAGAFEPIHFEDAKRDLVSAYLTTVERGYRTALDATTRLIDGFESPLGMEVLATVDWIVDQQRTRPELQEIKAKLAKWPGGNLAAERKLRLFEDRIIGIAVQALSASELAVNSST